MAKEFIGKQTLAKLIAMIRSEFKKFPAPEKVATHEYVDEEIAKFDFIKIVTELPESGLVNRTYFVPKDNGEANDLYDEYMWINDDWEYRGSKQIEVDLTDYVKSTDYAGNGKYGVVTTHGNYGVNANHNGLLCIAPADEVLIANKIDTFRPITPNKLDYAVKKGLCDSKLASTGYAWTEEEKTAARELLGVPIGNGSGKNSAQQALDAESWTPTNTAVIQYIADGIAGDGGIIRAENGTALVGTYGKNSAGFNGKSQTLGGRSHAEGSKNIAFMNNSHAEGNETFAAGQHAHAEGSLTSALGTQSHAEGATTVASGDASHAEGNGTTASGDGAHSEGNGNTASGDGAHSEGNGNTASGEASHAEGAGNLAQGRASHAEGDSNKATGNASHVGGVLSEAKHDMSFVHGIYLKTGRTNQVAFGEYNKGDENAVFEVGNGTSESDRRNAFQVNADGTAYVNGKKMGDVDLTDYVKNTDYASADVAGVVKVGNGLTVNPKTNALGIVGATESQISDKLSNQQAITPANLDFAVKTSVTTNTIELTADEQEAAQKWLGMVAATNEAKPFSFVKRSANGVIYTGTPTEAQHAATKAYVDNLVGDIETALDGIIAIQNELLGGEGE